MTARGRPAWGLLWSLWPSLGAAQPAPPCTPAAISTRAPPGSLPEEAAPREATPGGGSPGPRWDAALRDLQAALAAPGHPWSCSATRVWVVADGPSAVRVVIETPDGRRATRHVATPAVLSAAVEALLVTGPEPPPAPPAPPAPPVTPTRAQVAETERPPPVQAAVVPATPSPGKVWLEVGVDGGMRLVGPATTLMATVRLHAGLCLGHACLGAWARYEAMVSALDPTLPSDMDLQALGLGVAAAWASALGAGRIEAGPTVGVASVVEAVGDVDGDRANTVVQPRLGVLARWRSVANGPGVTVVLDADGALGALLRTGSGLDPRLPRPPEWTVAASVGAVLGAIP